MSLDATASAALDDQVIKPVYFAWLDIVSDPVRANTSGANVQPSGSGDADLDGYIFYGLSANFAEVSSVKNGPGGSDSVTAKLSGIASLDAATLALIGDRSNWQGRQARLWRIVRNAANVQQGLFDAFYTGYMTELEISAAPDSQVIIVTIENYLTAFSAASNRSYLDQIRYDAGDESARAAIAIANGNTGNPVTNNTPSGGYYQAGGYLEDRRNVRNA